MGVFSLCVAVLLFSTGLAHLNEGKKGNELEVSLTNASSVIDKKDTVKQLLLDHRVESSEIITEKNSTLIVANKHDGKKKRPSKRRKNRVNQLNQKGRRPSGRNRRPPNEKKGNKKAKQPSSRAVRYLARSAHTDQLNKAVDDMLACMSQTLATQNSTFSVRLNTFRTNMKISPWAFVALNKTNTIKMAEKMIDEKTRRVRAANDFKNEAAEVDTESYEDDDDAMNPEEETTLDPVTENSNDIGESSTVPEEFMATEEDDVDDSAETVTYVSVNITQSKKDNVTGYHRTQQPPPVVLPDGTVEYSLQLLSDNEIQNRKLGFAEEESSQQREDSGRQAKELDGERDQSSSRSYPRRPSATVEGIGFIQRNGDVLVGMRQNSTAHIIDTQLLIGPLQYVMDRKSGFLLQQSRVSMPQLTAKLRLTEVDGKLVAVRFKPTKIRPNEALVTLRLSENGKVPSHLETARLVSYLSREMTRVWNSGYLLRRVKRQFKQLFIEGTTDKKTDSKHDDARKIVQMLAFSAFEEPLSADTGKDNKELSKA